MEEDIQKDRGCVIISPTEHVPQANMVVNARDPKVSKTLSLPPVSLLTFVESGHDGTSVEKNSVNATW